MKISNLAILFIALTLPVILLLSAYTEIQIDTLSLQTMYDSKLNGATYDGISALKINTINNNYSTVSDSLIRDVKACISTFTNSLSSGLGLGVSGEKYIMPYVPALVFTLYDGYYIYSPYKITGKNGETSYSHTLKPYVYYSEEYSSGSNNIVICYSLDNYVAMYGTVNGESFSEAGYLILGDKSVDTEELKIYEMDNNGNVSDTTKNSSDAQEYYKKAKNFTEKYNNRIKALGSGYDFLVIEGTNDPELEDSHFTLEKRRVMKDSIVSNLNQAIQNYTEHSDMLFKLQEFSAEDWEKIYNNVCMISFLEGIPVGTKTYSNYSVIASTGNLQYTNKSQIYYIAEGDGYYHRLGCPLLAQDIRDGKKVVGYKNTDFDVKKKEITISSSQKETSYYCEHIEKACYNCIVESNYERINYGKIEQYKEALGGQEAVNVYYRSIGRIRYNLNKTSEYINKDN